MQMSERGIRLLQQWEGFKLKLYKDAAGLPTIGVGHLLTRDELTSGKILIARVPVKYAAGLTEQQARDLLAQDLDPAEAAVASGVTVPLAQHQFDALVSFTFNSGTRAFAQSTLLKVLNEGKYASVPEQLRRWTRAAGKVLPGLVNRRENEIRLWNGQF